MTQISGGSGPSFGIGSTGGTNYARFANNTSTPSWASALSQIGGAWAEAHNKQKLKEANLAQASERATKRQGWMQSLGAGATLRDVAASDPSVLGDTDFIKFAHSTKAPKGFTNVQDDEGNIIGQRGPDNRWYDDPRAAPDVEAQAPERRTAKDQFGRLRYLDDGSPAFSDAVMGPGPAPEADAPPPLKDQLQMVRQLSDDWQKTVLPMQGLLDQSDRMDIGLQMARGGDMLAGSQAILISFNKLLDPTSVVRESEYARSASGQSALETMRGFVDKLTQGGAGVTLEELQSYARFGEQVVQRALESTVGPERERILRLVEFAGVDPALIFSGRFAPKPPQGEAPPPPPRTATGTSATGTSTPTGTRAAARPRPACAGTCRRSPGTPGASTPGPRRDERRGQPPHRYVCGHAEGCPRAASGDDGREAGRGPRRLLARGNQRGEACLRPRLS